MPKRQLCEVRYIVTTRVALLEERGIVISGVTLPSGVGEIVLAEVIVSAPSFETSVS